MTIFDYENSLERLGGDRQLFDEILDIFLEDAPKVLSQATSALDRADAGDLERAAHSLKGLAGNFAAAAAVSAAYAVELHAREHKLDKAAICFPRLQVEIERLASALGEFQQGHRKS